MVEQSNASVRSRGENKDLPWLVATLKKVALLSTNMTSFRNYTDRPSTVKKKSTFYCNVKYKRQKINEAELN